MHIIMPRFFFGSNIAAVCHGDSPVLILYVLLERFLYCIFLPRTTRSFPWKTTAGPLFDASTVKILKAMPSSIDITKEMSSNIDQQDQQTPELPSMGPKTKLFLDTLVVGMNQAEKDLIIAGFPGGIVFPVPAEHKPDGMGVASVTETGIEMPNGYSIPFEDGEKYEGLFHTPSYLACWLLGSILSGTPIILRCPKCEKDACSRCGHVRY